MSDLLLHYTNQAGLVGILRSNALWHTDYRFTNDASEIIHAKERLEKIFHKKLDNFHSEIYDVNEDHKGEVARIISEIFVDAFNFSVFICSFSKLRPEDDFALDNGTLSMWRGYGKYRDRFALVFDRKELFSSIFKKGIEMRNEHLSISPEEKGLDLNYEDTTSFSDDELSYFINYAISASLDPEKTSSLDENKAFRMFMEILQLKHKGFKEEREVRSPVVIGRKQPGEDYIPHLSKLLLKNREVPTLPIKFSKSALKGIIIGPNTDEDRARNLIEHYQKSYGWPEIEIKKSTIPFVD